MNPLDTLPKPPIGQTGITLDQFRHLPPPPAGQKGMTLSEIQQTQTQSGDVIGAGLAGDLSAGVVKGASSTLLGLGGIGQKIQSGLASGARALGFNLRSGAGGENSIFNPQSATGQKAREIVTPQGTAQNIGYGAEQIAEFFIPAAKAAKAERVVDVISKGLTSPLAGATARIVGKGLVQGATAGAVTAAQTGGDVKKTLQSAATAGIIRGGFATIGEGSRALKIPERLYSTIFKNNKQDMMAELNENGLKAIQSNKPELYAEWVKKGLIKTGADGNPKLNETLAEQALDKGLRGSIKTMANDVVEKTIQSEDNVRTVLGNYKGTVNLKEQQFQNILKSIADEYKDVGFGEISKDANRLANALKKSKGAVDGITALDIRRLLDKARIARSFDVAVTKLSLSQANLKQLADVVRTRVNAVENVGSLMKDYSFYIDALESLASEAARRGNHSVLGLIDTIFLGSGIAGNATPQGAVMAMVAKYLRSGKGTTGLAQTLNKSVASPATSGAIGAVSGLMTKLGDQQ